MGKRSTAGTIEPNGSIIMWLACLVFGVSAGLLLTYHLLLSSRAAPLPTAKAATSFARANSSSMQSIHRDALQDAATARRAS